MAQQPIRSVDYSSDSEDDSVGHAPNQALPIANLPFNFNGIPQDGMEYLFTVRFSSFLVHPAVLVPRIPKFIEMSFTDDPIVNYRRDSRLLPRFTRVDHPATNAAELPLTEEEPTNKTLHSAFPTEEWRTEYVQRFLNYRQNLRRALEAPNAPGRPAPTKVQLPNWQNRNEWWRFITGSPRKGHETLREGTTIKNGTEVAEVVDSERDTNGAHEPTLSMLNQFSLRNVTSLLHWFSVWITAYTDSLEVSGVQSSGDENGERSGPATTPVTGDNSRVIEGVHQRWMFALLGMLDSELVGNDISTLRVLARAAIRLVQLLTKEDTTPAQESRYVLGTADPEGAVAAREAPAVAAKDGGDAGTQSTIAGCWMIIAAIVGVWRQRDVWDEAREALSTSG